MLKSLAGVITMGTAMAQPPTFDGYNIYPGTRPLQQNRGCLLAPWINGTGAAEIATMICDLDEDCRQFGDYNADLTSFNAWTAAEGTVTYISTKRCGDASVPPGTVTPPSCAVDVKHAPSYYTCTEGAAGGRHTALATFQLPPFQIAESWNRNNRCVAFTTDTDGSTGTL
eukprot:SAG25_NODE_2235_length_1811_cov_1.254089_2_plen_170_part_00